MSDDPKPNTFEPQSFEDRIYRFWEESGFFSAQEESDREPYCIVIPPPNVTGALHIGHALTNTIEDIFIRWKRMCGFNTLWLPGLDHAGIATQSVVERHLKRTENKSRHDYGREQFVAKVWEWKQKYGGRIILQLRRLGSSLDWSRQRFTLDDNLSKAVTEVFVSLFEEGLIYRDFRLINWCPNCRSALSNLEVEHSTHEGNFWYINYPLVEDGVVSTTEFITLATTRPETMLGDTAVAVHPDPRGYLEKHLVEAQDELERLEHSGKDQQDQKERVSEIAGNLDPDILAELERYASYVGKSVRLPVAERDIPVIADQHADPTKGTGAVKITPAHDFNDFEVGKRNNLDSINILNDDATLNEVGGIYVGQHVTEARKNIIAALRAAQLLQRTETRMHEVGQCQRCHTVVEPYLSRQWFVDAKPLAKPCIEAVRNKDVTIVPAFHEKTFYHWMENITDWCISRQLWWGHQIPAWYCPEGHVTVSREPPEKCCDCGVTGLERDPDVLDTWFSSGLWPFSTLGWPEETKDLKTFYPNSMMETGSDILFFWVARMMMFGIHFMKQPPFPVVYLHAMVRDWQGRKMSKSLGNTIDPLDVMDGISQADLLAKVEDNLPILTPKQKESVLQEVRDTNPDGIAANGADALRFTMAIMAAQGRDVKFSVPRVVGYKGFLNKIWQASHGVILRNLEGYHYSPPDLAALSPVDRWIRSRFSRTLQVVESALEGYRLNEAAESLYQFFWSEYCDWYLELAKPAIFGEDAAARQAALDTLVEICEGSLRALHPFIPFVTEEIWQKLPKSDQVGKTIMLEPYPKPADYPRDSAAESWVATVQEIINGLRTIRGENRIKRSVPLPVTLVGGTDRDRTLVGEAQGYIQKLVNTDALQWPNEAPEDAAHLAVGDLHLYVPLKGLVDFDEEITRLDKEMGKLTKQLEKLQKKLGNPSFLNNAPEDVRQKVTEEADQLEKDLGFKEKSQAHFRAMKSD